MNSEEFQQRVANRFADRLPDASEETLQTHGDIADTPVTHYIWRSYNAAMMEALADVLVEAGLLTD